MIKQRLVDITVFLLRVVAGLLFLQHGGMKLLGWFGGMPGGEIPTLMFVAGILELVGGALIILGLFIRPVAFILAGEMAVAYFKAHFSMEAIFPIQNGGEPAALFAFIFLFFAAYGAGRWSLDEWIRNNFIR